MGLEEKNLIDFKETSSGVDEVLKRHKQRVNDASFLRYKRFLFSLAILLGLLMILMTYFYSSASKVKAISVNGNDYIDSEYIKKLSGLSLESRYYLIPWFITEAKIKEYPLISDAKIHFEANNVIKIDITEKKPVGYRYNEKPEIILSDGKTVELTSEMLSIVARIPLITGFVEDENLYLITKSLNLVDKSKIENISEIKQYDLNYDKNALMLYLRDGNFVFSSFYSLEMINSYNSIASELIGNGHCIFLDEGLQVAYRKVCPWDEVIVEKEYWKNANGEYILNKYGDKVPIHYQVDENGQFILDEAGNKIPIPINEFGEEIQPEPPAQEEAEQQNVE